MERDLQVKLINYLKNFITDGRWETINAVLNQRTDYLTVVLEDIYQPHNASAVLRSCDGFGIQNVHVIEKQCEFDASSQVTLGADQWLDIIKYNAPDVDNTISCIEALKQKGYRIIATTPHEKESDINDLDLSQPIALIFGNELNGFSESVFKHADGFVKIPMHGFSESFNISVSAAICLYDITTRLRNPDLNIDWELSTEQKDTLMLQWLISSIKAGEQLVEKYLREEGNS
ncbi:MAG: RNA methyltransferase [Balneolaceae bacterium]